MTPTDSTRAADEETPRPLRRDAARNRDALLAAARTVFAERGLEASLDDVAREAGLGVGTAYRHFANKYELAKAIFAQAIDDLAERADAAAASDAPAWEGIVAFLEYSAEEQSRDRGLREVMMGVHDDEEFDRVNERLSAPFRTLVVRAKAEGTLRPDAEISDLALTLVMLCTVADVTAEVAPDLWRRYLPVLLDGLRPGQELPVPPLEEEALRTAMKSHKQRLVRATQLEK
jgi:AcrR family transcriptional regulator